MVKFENLISHWGYIAVFIGTLIEGEVTMIVGSFLASQKILDIKYVMLVGAVGGFIGDQIFFLMGKLGKNMKMMKKLERNVRFRKARRIVRRYGTYIILFSRYLIGMRMALSTCLGVFNIPVRQFTLLNLISAALWAVTVGLFGFILGKAAMAILGDIKKYEWLLVLTLVVVAVLGYQIKKRIKKVEEKLS
ncbi:MAG: DedA family protein [Deferribacteres bacterium]|nr:DedA family protein [Deferribacteres bacterium]